jgi:hypothetical protein
MVRGKTRDVVNVGVPSLNLTGKYFLPVGDGVYLLSPV